MRTTKDATTTWVRRVCFLCLFSRSVLQREQVSVFYKSFVCAPTTNNQENSLIRIKMLHVQTSTERGKSNLAYLESNFIPFEEVMNGVCCLDRHLCKHFISSISAGWGKIVITAHLCPETWPVSFCRCQREEEEKHWGSKDSTVIREKEIDSRLVKTQR